MPTDAPYLSVVVTARNDDHGGNLLGRMQAFVSGWIDQAKRFQIPSELIVVEWNPPPARPRLYEVLRWPADFGPCQVRFLEVPAELHRRYSHAEALPLYQMIAKNVGIRRARGQFVLATNIDILFSSELAEFFAARRLQDGFMYRIDRHDAMADVPVEEPIADQFAWCRNHLIRVNRREGTFNVSPSGEAILSPGDVAAPETGLLFGKGWLPVEHYKAQEPFRWVGQHAELLLCHPPETAAALEMELEPGPGTAGAPLDLEVLDKSHQTLARVSVERRSRLFLPLIPPYPTALTFRVRKEGSATPKDPRVLNFRVFHVDWARSRGSGEAEVRPIRNHNRVAAVWYAVQHVIDRLAKGGRLVELTVPVDPRTKRMLKQYVEFRGFVGMARQALPYLERRRMMRAAGVGGPDEDIFQKGSGLLPGARWSVRDDYRGETYRRTRNGGEILVGADAPDESEIVLLLEPLACITEDGTHLPAGPVDFRVVDASGKVIAEHQAAGLVERRFRVPRIPRTTQVFHLEFEGAELKVYRCAWAGLGKALAPGLTLPWGAGWEWNTVEESISARDRAELVVTASEQGAGPLFLELETPRPADFEIRDQQDHLLASFHHAGRETHRLELPLAAGQTHVLSLIGTGRFRAWRCDWTASPREETPTGPAFLHTNACGDFTLLSRRQWFDLRAYPEFDLFSMNLDSIFCATAHFGGAREEMLEEPMRIYHIEHGTGSGWTPEGQAKLFERIAAKGLKFVDFEDVMMWTAQMGRLGAPMLFNHEDWGLAEAELKETILWASVFP